MCKSRSGWNHTGAAVAYLYKETHFHITRITQFHILYSSLCNALSLLVIVAVIRCQIFSPHHVYTSLFNGDALCIVSFISSQYFFITRCCDLCNFLLSLFIYLYVPISMTVYSGPLAEWYVRSHSLCHCITRLLSKAANAFIQSENSEVSNEKTNFPLLLQNNFKLCLFNHSNSFPQ